MSIQPVSSGKILAEKSMSLSDRYPVASVNEVFKENILLSVAYMEHKKDAKQIEPTLSQKSLHYEVTLHSGEVFAFHDNVLPEFKGKVVATTNAHFNSYEGFKSDGYLIGDGVCHFASLIDYAASSAGLSVYVPTSHDFANIPDVPKKYGVSIYSSPTNSVGSARQNLYVTNSFSEPVILVFDYHNSVLSVSIVKQTS